jgi:hypothetical protein
VIKEDEQEGIINVNKCFGEKKYYKTKMHDSESTIYILLRWSLKLEI